MIRHYFYIQYAELFHGYDLFLNLSFYHGTSMLMGTIQIGDLMTRLPWSSANLIPILNIKNNYCNLFLGNYWNYYFISLLLSLLFLLSLFLTIIMIITIIHIL